MKSCFHKGVCKHFNEDLTDPKGECSVVEVCKFYVGMDWSELKKPIGGGSTNKPKRHYKRRAKPRDDDDIDNIPEGGPAITEKAFKKARKKLDRLERLGKLDDNQVKALESYKGKHYKTLTDAQREQIVSMAKGK